MNCEDTSLILQLLKVDQVNDTMDRMKWRTSSSCDAHATRLGQPLRNFTFLSFLVNISSNKDAFSFQLYAVDLSPTDLSLE